MDHRLARHLLRRLRHRLEANAIDDAVECGILVERLGTVAGRRLRAFAPGPMAIGKSEAGIVILLRRHRHHTGTSTAGSDDAWVDFVSDDNKDAEGFRSGTDQRSARPENSLGVSELLRVVRGSADALRPESVAALLLVAQSMTMSETSLEEVLRMLRTPRPIVTIVGRVAGFEHAFLELLEDGLILPGTATTCAGYGLNRRLTNIRFSSNSGWRWRVIAFSGSDHDEMSDEAADRQVGLAAGTTYPILGVAETEDQLPPSLMRAATVRLTCGPLTMPIVRETIRAVLGEEPQGGITWQLCEALTIADLALAIRTGVPARRVLELLEEMARSRIATTATQGSASGSGSGTETRSSANNPAKKSGRGDPGSGSERIEPMRMTVTDTDRVVPRIESLAGYGEATAWARDLAADLGLWQVGELAWEDMSAKLLLSGPPGTGKTTFARALCNSLRIPLFATSVATWLEPGYLGDVLKRMTAAFSEAEDAAPAILFIDEIDGINMRGSSGEWTTYWDQIINRLLELLDGATRSDGVVVIGATNNPDRIDAALLRSGRLEKHIVIPKPDTEALIGILRHHLGAELDAVIATAPGEPSKDTGGDGTLPTAEPGLAATGDQQEAASANQAYSETEKGTRHADL
ncbi:MAG: AAA family ATPase [Mesorhizobium sp.]|jgi:hypothetical protein